MGNTQGLNAIWSSVCTSFSGLCFPCNDLIYLLGLKAHLTLMLLAYMLHCFSHIRLCDPMDHSLPGSSVHGSPEARILEWAAISFSGVSFPPRDRTRVSCLSCTSRQIPYHQHHLRSSWMLMTPLLISELTPEPQIPVFNHLLGRSLPGGTSYTMHELMRISSFWSGSYPG